MSSFAVKTTGDSKDHYIEEKMPTPPTYPVRTVRVIQFAYDATGASVAGGPLSVGVEGAKTDVLEQRDGIAYHNKYVGRFVWNDNGNICYFSVELDDLRD